MCIFFHKWGKWKRSVVNKPAVSISTNYELRAHKELWQSRVCIDCGKSEQELMNDDYFGTEVPD